MEIQAEEGVEGALFGGMHDFDEAFVGFKD